MDFKNRNTSLEIRSVNDDTSVKTSRAQQCGVKDLRPVGSCYDKEALGCLETVHLSEQLVECLLTLVIAAVAAAVACLTYSVDLINENDARRVLLRLLKEVTDTARADTDEHLYKFRTGQREEGYMGFARHSLGKKCLACTGRSDQQSSLRKLGTDFGILGRVVQEIYALLKAFLGLIFTGHILESNPCVLLDVGLGPALADAHHTAAAAHPVHEDADYNHKEDERDKE